MKVILLVSVDAKDTHQVFLPGVYTPTFRKPSMAELLDDVALYLMEQIPRHSPKQMARYLFCPFFELRKVKVEVALRPKGKKLKQTWKGRLAVVVRKWSSDNFYTCCIPRMSADYFAVTRTAYLEQAVKHFVEEWVKETGNIDLDRFVCQSAEFLELLDVEVDYPTLLPSHPKKKKKKKKPQQEEEKKPRKREMVAPTTLREVGINLTYRALDGRLQAAFGRDELVEQILLWLRREGAAILLVGASGVGKTAILHEVIRRMAAEDKPIQERSDVWEIDGNRLIAGMSMVGAWEQRCQQMIHELHARNDILYVNDLPSLVYTGRSAHSDTNVAQFFEPHLAHGDFRIIGECTPERLEATREECPGFFARFRVLQIPDLSERETIKVLLHATRRFEDEEELMLAPDVLTHTLALTRRFQAHEAFPGKAITLLRRAISDQQDAAYDDFGRRRIGRKELTDFFARQTGLPSFILWEQASRPASQIQAFFRRRVIAQRDATEAVTDIVTTLQQGLNDPQRPLATMLFVGPTGVGKTETAKALAMYLFGSPDRMIRFDMSEFMDPWAVSRLIGDRHQPEGDLTRKVAQQPFSVILLDEIEKGHPAVFDAMLQVLGEGRLTNAAGRTVDFCNTVVLMTSNLGVREAQRSLGFAEPDPLQMDLHYRKAAEGFFRPEFFNRIDRIVSFRSLGREAIAPLVERLLQDILRRRGLRRSQIMVQIDPDMIELLIDQGFEPRYGARSMKRLLEQRLAVPLARCLVTSPPLQNTLIQVFQRNKEIEMEIHNLHEETIETLPMLQPIQRWEELLPRYHALKEATQRIQDDPRLHRLREEHTALLERFNREQEQSARVEEGANPEFEQERERLVMLGEITHDLRALERELEQLHEGYLSPLTFVQVTEKREVAPPKGYERAIQEDVIMDIPMVWDAQRLLPQIREEITQLRLRLASLLYRVEMTQEMLEDEALLRILPVTEDPQTFLRLDYFAYVYACCWQSWSTWTLYARKKGQWSAMELDLMDFAAAISTAEQPQSFLHEIDGFAIHFRGPGIRRLLQEEIGFLLYTYTQGPDQICDLLRIEDIPLSPQGDEAIPSLLAQSDQAYDAYRRARREGMEHTNPRPPLKLSRFFQEHFCLDALTGESLSLVETANPQDTLVARLGRLAEGFYRVAMVRILARYWKQSRDE